MVVDEDTDEGPGAVPPRPLTLTAVAGSLVQFGGNVARSCVALCEDIATMLAQQTAHQWDRRDAWDRMHADLESLPTTVE